MENNERELCDVGWSLWLTLIDEYSNEKYIDYIDHIKSCDECKRGLDVDDVILENDLEVSESQVASWYHRQIKRIPHGKQNSTKRYLSDHEVLELFDGKVVIQEKVDGKMSFKCKDGRYGRAITIFEDMTGKHTVHNHVMKYTKLPANKKIVVEHILDMHDVDGYEIKGHYSPLTYATLHFMSSQNNVMPTIEQIHQILGAFAHSVSHFGADRIEGIVVKNYDKQLFGKWINDDFEDALNGK